MKQLRKILNTFVYFKFLNIYEKNTGNFRKILKKFLEKFKEKIDFETFTDLLQTISEFNVKFPKNVFNPSLIIENQLCKNFIRNNSI